MTEIARDEYLQKLINRKNNGMIKVITGIRRCGKSYLLFNIFYRYLLSTGVKEDHIIKLALDDYSNKLYRNPDELYQYVKNQIKDNDLYYVLLDEVQFVEGFEDVLNGFLHIQNVDCYVTGSNSKFLSKDIITEFRGRGDQIHVQPLSFSEFFSTSSKGTEAVWEEYIRFGGLPKITQMETEEEKISYLKNIFSETYIVDIVNRYKVKNQSELEELLDIISSSIGSLTNPNKLSNTFKSTKNKTIHPDTIKKYLDYFVDSFLVTQAKRYDIKRKRFINTPSKYYFSDIGLRNARLNFRQMEETQTMENIIYNELILRGYTVDVGVVEINEPKTKKEYLKKQLEIDFVCNKGDKRYYIQSALVLPTREKTIQEERPFMNVKDSFKKIIVVKDSLTYYTEEGILIISLFNFLLDKNSLDF